jgi:long-subunit fatty acid transport protein
VSAIVRFLSWTSLIYGFLAFSIPQVGHAGGVEGTVAGARAVGRGGAMGASATGFDALRYNPARLHLTERWNMGLDAQLHFTDVCFSREDRDGTTYPTVCNEASPLLVPQLGVTIPIGERFGIGIGVLPPPGATSQLEFGDPTTGTILVDGQRVASPSRFANIVTDNTALFPTIGFSASLHDRLRAGLSFGAGTIMVQSISFTAGIPGAGPSLDTRNALAGVDYFVPKIVFAVDAEPFDGFSIASITSFTGDLNADASLYLSGLSGGGFSTRVDDVTVNQAFGWETTVALRYAHTRFDFEVDVMYQGHARTDRTTVDIPDDAAIPIDVSIDGTPLGALPDVRYVERQWKNQLVLRAGGDALVVPDRLWLRAGVSYESNGNKHGYQSVENFLARRTALHVGASVQVHRALQLIVGYSRVFQPDTTVAPEDARVEQPVGARPPPLDDPNSTVHVNGGTYRGGLHVVAFGIRVQPAARRAEPARAATETSDETSDTELP